MNTKRLMKWSLLASAMLASAAAQATLIVDFEITNPNQSVGPNDVVTLLGRLTNSSSSTENLQEASLFSVSYSFGTTSPLYIFSFPAPSFFDQFTGLDLAAGFSFDFTFGTLTPSPAPVADGTYKSGPLSIDYFNAAGQSQTAQYDSVSVTVGRQAVPEPASLALLGIGLAGLGAMRRRKTA